MELQIKDAGVVAVGQRGVQVDLHGEQAAYITCICSVYSSKQSVSAGPSQCSDER